MREITYHHNKRHMDQALGLDHGRFDEIAEIVKDIMLDPEYEKLSERIEAIEEEVEPTTTAEYVLIGMMVSDMKHKVHDAVDTIIKKHKPELKKMVSRAKEVLEMLADDEDEEDEEDEKPVKTKKRVIN